MAETHATHKDQKDAVLGMGEGLNDIPIDFISPSLTKADRSWGMIVE